MADDPTTTAAYGVRYKDGTVVPATNREQAERVAANLGGEVVTLCMKGGRPHLPAVHGRDGHDLPHNPWSDLCVKRLLNEPHCPDARCMTCDGARP